MTSFAVGKRQSSVKSYKQLMEKVSEISARIGVGKEEKKMEHAEATDYQSLNSAAVTVANFQSF